MIFSALRGLVPLLAVRHRPHGAAAPDAAGGAGGATFRHQPRKVAFAPAGYLRRRGVLCDVAVILAARILGRGALLLAILGTGATMYLLAIVFGFAAALLIDRLRKKNR